MQNTIQFVGRSRFLNQSERKKIRFLLHYFSKSLNFDISSLVYVHLNDAELLEINEEHLAHDDYTDIITFDLSDTEGVIDGEIYISTERVKENAVSFGTSFDEEYIRVVAHGLFHLMGFRDKTETEIREMRLKEQEAIDFYKTL
jgi:rRNA maturation RNase YbeY